MRLDVCVWRPTDAGEELRWPAERTIYAVCMRWTCVRRPPARSCHFSSFPSDRTDLTKQKDVPRNTCVRGISSSRVHSAAGS